MVQSLVVDRLNDKRADDDGESEAAVGGSGERCDVMCESVVISDQCPYQTADHSLQSCVLVLPHAPPSRATHLLELSHSLT